MSWKNLSLRWKFTVGFGGVLFLLMLVAGWALIGVGGIVGNAKEVIQGNALRAELIQREVDHLIWANAVSTLLTDSRVTRLEVETDHSQCGFGKWYYGEGRKRAEQLVPELKEPLARIEEPHKALHQSAIAIGQVFQEADTKLASEIYITRTMPNLEKVRELLHEIINTAGDHIMTDQEMLAAAGTTRLGSIILTVVALPFGCILAFVIAKGIIDPLRKSCTMIEEMEKGHLEMRLNLDRGDEIGRMAQSMDRFADSLQEEIIGSLQKLADGDLTFRIVPKDERDRVRGTLQKLGRDLSTLITQIQASGEQIATGSTQIAESAQHLSQGATESAASLEQISASMTQMSSQTSQAAENAGQARHLATQARSAAEKGNLQMEEMVSAMFDINEAGQNISKIIKVIDEIAFQTNLLALNAAVEAARAGQHGKGFAVVAEEVRNLAARSAKAAKETSELIEGSQKKTENGTRIAGETEAALKEIVTSVVKVTDLVSEIAAASAEQAEGISQVNTGLGQIDMVTQQNTANAEESAAAAEELAGQADQLRGMLTRFKVGSETGALSATIPARKRRLLSA
ncbi:MAG: methyl-accepting chemotaxis protein [Syntrophotaleaceae bacterium]